MVARMRAAMSRVRDGVWKPLVLGRSGSQVGAWMLEPIWGTHVVYTPNHIKGEQLRGFANKQKHLPRSSYHAQNIKKQLENNE